MMETTHSTALNINKATNTCPHGGPLELNRKAQRVIPSVWLLNDIIYYSCEASQKLPSTDYMWSFHSYQVSPLAEMVFQSLSPAD